MSLKVSIIFFSFIIAIEAVGMCPDPNGWATIPCVFVPGCQFAENGSLTTSATHCSNQLPDLDCQQLFPCDPAGTPACDPNAVVPVADQDSYPYVRAPACTNPSLHDIAMKCK